MSFARDKLYNGYLRRNMPTIVSTVKVKQIIPHLPCLTDHDRENIEAKRETYGNHDGMVLLLDCLKRRENWAEEFIAAIEACEHRTIAAEIRAEYDALRGASNSNPSSPPTTVVRAHVHPAPSANHPPVPESGADSQPALSPQAEAAAPPEPAAQPSPPLQIPVQTKAPQSSAAEVPEDVPPPEPVTEPPKAQIEVAPPPSTPPPSPATPRSQATGVSSPRREINFHQEPEENSESDIQEISGNNEVIPDEASAGKGEVLIDSVEAPKLSSPVEQSETETPSCSDLLQTTTTTTTTTEVGPPRSPSPTENDSDVTDGAPVTTMTPEKPPVQDTTPPSAALEPEETSKPPTKQTVESSPQRETAATVSPLHAAAEMDAPLYDDSSECLSKPGELISVCSQSDDTSTMRAPSPPVEPYSGDSERLEFSQAAPDTVTSPDTPACSAVSSTTVNSVSAPPCMENGIADNHNEPEENQYESPSQSLGMQEVLVNVVHVSGEPSILNLAGQNSTPQAQTVNGETAKEIKSAPLASSDPSDTISDVKTPSNESYNPPL
ncbi:mitochondrial antiviral-signaling protein isoform 2-T2 [Tautogolabrus adspersus]